MATFTRPAVGDEICSCGRPALFVYVTPGRVDVGWCGRSEVDPLSRCRDIECPILTAHDVHWCTTERRADFLERYRCNA